MNTNLNRERITIENSVLIVIDIQEKLFPLIANKEEVAKNNQILIEGAKALGLQTIVTEQYPKGIGSTINELKNSIQDLALLQKLSFSCVVDLKSSFEDIIKAGKNTFILSGIETHICVYQTAKDLLNMGQRVCLVYDACGSRKKENHQQMINTLRNLGALILPTESVLFELMTHSKHKEFKTISKLVK